jgi:hypothetical protein
MRLPVFAKSVSQLLTTKTGGSLTSLLSRRLLSGSPATAASGCPNRNWNRTGLPALPVNSVFVNGHFVRELSLLGKLPDGMKVSGLAGEISSNPGAIERHLGRYLDVRRDAFCALNTAFVEDGAFVRIPRGTLVEEPICLVPLIVRQPAMNQSRLPSSR